MNLLPLLLLPLCWFLLVRPQRQRITRQRELLRTLAPGDEVVTVGGILGRVVAADAERVRLEVAPGVVVAVVPPAIGSRVDRPTAPPRDTPLAEPGEAA